MTVQPSSDRGACFRASPRPLTSVVLARLTRQGHVLTANAGFLALTGCAEAPSGPWDGAGLFLQPTFGQLLEAAAGAGGGVIFRGTLTVGREGNAGSVRGAVYRTDNGLLLTGETDWDESPGPIEEPAATRQRSIDFPARRLAESEGPGSFQKVALLHAIQESLPDGLCAVDRSGRVLFWNPAAEALLGWAQQEVLGQRLLEFLPWPDGAEVGEALFRAVLEERRTIRRAGVLLTRKDGSRLPAAYAATPLVRGGELAGALLVFCDSTERRRAEEAGAADHARGC